MSRSITREFAMRAVEILDEIEILPIGDRAYLDGIARVRLALLKANEALNASEVLGYEQSGNPKI